jgi:uncharacterized protein YecE (DUF72 family)
VPRPGRVLAGTSGFSYPGWAPRFYPPGLRARDLLPHYAGRLPAASSTHFYARPTAERIRGWCAAVPDTFRFVVKAQRGASVRALYGDPTESVPWLTATLPEFGGRLGAVLFRVPGEVQRQDERLGALLRAWPVTIPLVVEAQHGSWHVDETFGALRDAGAVLCSTDLDDLDAPPDICRTGAFLYLRLRRTAYDDAALDAWARRLVPFLDDGLDWALTRRLAVGAPNRAERAMFRASANSLYRGPHIGPARKEIPPGQCKIRSGDRPPLVYCLGLARNTVRQSFGPHEISVPAHNGRCSAPLVRLFRI